MRDMIAVIDLRILSLENRVRISLTSGFEKMLENILGSKEFLEDFLRISCEFISAY